MCTNWRISELFAYLHSMFNALRFFIAEISVIIFTANTGGSQQSLVAFDFYF